MNLLSIRRQLPDGKYTIGPIFYIGFLVIVLAGFIYLNLRNSTTENYNVGGSKLPAGKVDLNALTSAAANNSKVTTGENITDNSKLDMTEHQKSASTDNSSMLDTVSFIRSNMQDTTPAASVKKVDEGQLDVHSRRNQAQNGSTGGAANQEARMDIKSLIVYDAATDKDLLKQQQLAAQAQSIRNIPPTGFQTKDFLPRGEKIPVYFLSQVRTSKLEDMVTLGVAQNVIFNHRVQIPFGTRIYGSAAQDPDGTRVAINADTMVFPDGTELPISGVGLDVDQMGGVQGYYVPQPLWVTLLPYVNSFVASYIDTFQKVQNQTTTLTDANGVSQTTTQPTADTNDTRTVALASISNALRAQMQAQQQRLNNIYPDYVDIPVGMPAFIQLRSALDLKARAVNGSAKSTMTILPGFQNNPITPSGQVLNQAFKPQQDQNNNPVMSIPQGLQDRMNLTPAQIQNQSQPSASTDNSSQDDTTSSGTSNQSTVPGQISTPSTPLSSSPMPSLNDPNIRGQITNQNQQGLKDTFDLPQ